MRRISFFILAVALCGCASRAPVREAGWWTGELTDTAPVAASQIYSSKGETCALKAPGRDDHVEFKWTEHLNGAPMRTVHLDTGGPASMIVPEYWADGSVLRMQLRQLETRIGPDESAMLREAVVSSGVLELREAYVGGDEFEATIGLRIGDELWVCAFDGGYPPAAAAMLTEVWNSFVLPNAEEFSTAPVHDYEDWQNDPAFRPLE